MNQSVEQALQKIGNQHLYQKILVVLLVLVSAELNFLLLGPTFFLMNPLFQCNFTQELVDEYQACSQLSSCTIANSYTLTAHMKLYCDKQLHRNILQTIVSIGSVLGLIIINSVSDILGRKFALVFAQIVGMVGVILTLLGGLLQSIQILGVGQFLSGFCGYTMLMLVYVMPTQFCGEEFLQRSLIIINYSISISTVVIGLLYYFYNMWYNYLFFIILVPMLLILIFSLLFLVEGPFFLYAKNKKKECLQSLKTIAKFNSKIEQFQVLSTNFLIQKAQQVEVHAPSLLQYLKMIIILILAELGGNLYFFASGYALDQIGYEYGANMIAAGLVQLGAIFTLSFFVTEIPRKSGLIIFYGVTIALGLLFFINELRTQKIPAFILMAVIRYFFTLGFTLVLFFLTTEAFPTSIQATCAGIIEAIAQLGSFLGPIIITLCINWQVYPIIAISFLAVLIIQIPLFFLKTQRRRQLRGIDF